MYFFLTAFMYTNRHIKSNQGVPGGRIGVWQDSQIFSSMRNERDFFVAFLAKISYFSDFVLVDKDKTFDYHPPALLSSVSCASSVEETANRPPGSSCSPLSVRSTGQIP